MPRRKTKTLAWSFLQYRLDDLERRVRAQTRKFHGAAPEDLRGALGLLILCHDVPDIILGSTPEGQILRVELATFITKFPECASAGLRSLSRKPRPKLGPSAIVREFLLTQSCVDLPDGRRVSDVGAWDREIASAAQSCYEQATGRALGKDISAVAVKRVRQRLERKYGLPVASLAEWCFRVGGLKRCPKWLLALLVDPGYACGWQKPRHGRKSLILLDLSPS